MLFRSYKKNPVKAIASIFDEFTCVMNDLSCKKKIEKFLSHQLEANEIQAFSCVLLKNPCRFVTVVNTEIIWSIALIIDVRLRLGRCFQQ